MADRKISELTNITGANVDDTNDEIAIVDASASETKAITRGELFSDVASGSFDGDVTVGGNLTVNGTTVTIDTTTLDVADKNITIAKDAPDAATADGAGLTVDGANATITYDSTDDTWDFNKGVSTTGDIEVTGTVDGRNVASDGSKLDGIESNADVTDTANVTAAGALMDSELTSEASVKALDQGVSTTDSPEFAGLTVDTDTLFVDASANRVGIGTSSPDRALTNAGNITSTRGDNPWYELVETDGTTTHNKVRLYLTGDDFLIQSRSDADAFVSNDYRIFRGASGATAHQWSVGSSEAMRIDSSGNVGIGKSNPDSLLHTARGTPLDQTSTANGRGTIHLSAESNSADTDNQILNAISFSGGDTNRRRAMIANLQSNGLGSGGHIAFFNTTSTGGNDTVIERMRIDSSGNVGIGTSSPDEVLHTTDFVKADTGFYAGQSKSLSSSTTTTRFVVAQAGSNTRLWQASNTDQPLFVMHRSTTTGQMLRFVQGDPSTNVGNISVTASSTSYNTSSDYRLKEDLKPVPNPSDRVLALNPVNFAWKTDGTRVDGFLAHEAQEVVPEAVTGEKDALDSEGNPEYQGIDQGKLVPLLTAALQDALQKIEALETRVIELEQGQ